MKGEPVSAARRTLTFEEQVERDFPVQHLVEVEAIHADDALATTERDEAVIGEAAVADEETSGPGRLLLDLAVEGVQLGDADGLAMPFGFEQVGLASELEAAVDLLAAKTKGSFAARPIASNRSLRKPSNA